MSVCIPARNEAPTLGPIVRAVADLFERRRIDELVVVDDGSSDNTAAIAAAAGARVIDSPDGPGKGQALRQAVAATTGEILVFLDADVANFRAEYVTKLATALQADPALQLVKATYGRPLRGQPEEGGRVTELVARPLLEHYFPDLATVAQPLAGECSLRRSLAEQLRLDDGYGIEVGLLIDTYLSYGRDAIGEVEVVSQRIHRNRPLRELTVHARQVLAAVMTRAGTARPQCG